MIHCGFNLEFNYFSVHFWSPINLLTDQSLSLLPDDAYSSTYNYQTFEIVPEEANNEVYIVEAEDASNYQAGSSGGIEACRDPPTRYCSGGQQFDFNGQGSFIEWEVTVSAEMAGTVPISFRYTNGDDYNDGNRPVRLMVNNVTVVESHDFFYTEWNYYRYSDMVYTTLNEGLNTIKLVDDAGIGPDIGKYMHARSSNMLSLTNNSLRPLTSRQAFSSCDEDTGHPASNRPEWS